MSSPTSGRLTRLAELSGGLVSELDPEAVLDQILDLAMTLTGARYGALGILDESREEFAEFRTRGVEADMRASIWEPPTGLSVPVRVRGEAWGNLYLAEKADGDFTDADEELSVVFAAWAATAIELARLHERSERRREQLENAVRGLEAVRDVATAIGGETGFDRVLELIAKRGRALIRAGSLLVMLREGEELVVAASAGDEPALSGLRLPIAHSACGRVFEDGHAAQFPAAQLTVPQSHIGLLVPMSYRGKPLGLLAAFDSAGEGPAFSTGDEQLLGVFAVTAANALAMAQSVEADRLRSSMAAADHERGHWARELHDETLQGLGALRLLLVAALRRDDQAAYAGATREAIGQVEEEIANLRAIISDLRPAALDELGLRPAIAALLRRRGENGFSIHSTIDLPDSALGEARLAPERESTVYRLVQEALTNVAKHADARVVHVEVTATAGDVVVEVRDDGTGFDTEQATEGFGLAGMRERVYLAGGTFRLDSGPAGTRVRARLTADPSRERASPDGGRAGAGVTTS